MYLKCVDWIIHVQIIGRVNLDQNDDDEVQSIAVVLEFEISDNSLELIVNQLAILAFEDP